MRRCAFLTMEDSVAFVIDDDLSHGPLRELGWSVDTVPWSRADTEWERYDVVVVRSTWDYHLRPESFLESLAEDHRHGLAGEIRGTRSSLPGSPWRPARRTLGGAKVCFRFRR